MKRYYVVTVAICVAMLLAFGWIFNIWSTRPVAGVLKVGFIYENDESTPYTYNFALAQSALGREYPDRVETLSKSNVLGDEAEKPIRELIRAGCGMICTNIYSDEVCAMAAEFPDVQFCQASYEGVMPENAPKNFHTFNGEIYQGRYISGIAAGMKLKELIDAGDITADDAVVGFVGAYATAEVISSYTAFLLGVRSVVPEAVMRVRYTGAWSSYSLEKSCARKLIDEGCVVISQHTHTIGPAAACEEAAGEDGRTVFHVGYNTSMMDVAPTTALISTRVNWTPYIVGAVGAVLDGKSIEATVNGTAHGGNDMSAGFEKGWVEMLELNKHIAAEGTEERIAQTIEAFRRDKVEVFKGDYVGVNPDRSGENYELSKGFAENRDFSAPSFRYVLQDVIHVER